MSIIQRYNNGDRYTRLHPLFDPLLEQVRTEHHALLISAASAE